MHFVAFRLKRAHHASLRIARQIASRCALTPARFDLLYALWNHYFDSMSQMALRKILGVARSTVSRMLKSLEDLGIIQRSSDNHDRRTRQVGMTEAGRRQFLELLEMVRGWEEMDLAYDVAFGWPKDNDTFVHIDELFWTLKTIAEEFGDTGAIWYPTGNPED
ncbi:MAG: MarR family winged helix-turn-helix transcriptional regulator [Polyangiaceae bacterium]